MGVGSKQPLSRAADKPGMRIILLVCVIATGCTKANPNSCCTTAEQCSAVGLKDITSCKSGNVCDPYGACVKPQCAASTDCASPDAPICFAGLCVAKCTADTDCDGRSGTPYCAADGQCVACMQDSQCSTDKPVCDSGDHACRGCVADVECTGGICLEAPGTCTDASNVVFLRADGSDAGTCTHDAPCATFNYGFGQLSSQRDVIHLIGTEFNVGDNTVSLPNRSVYIDGERTEIRRQMAGPVFTQASNGSTIFSRVTLGSPSYTNDAFSQSQGELELYEARVPVKFTMTGGTLELAHSAITGRPTLSCTMGGTINMHDSTGDCYFLTTDCNVTLERNRFETTSKVLSGLGSGVFIVENNVIVSTDFFTDAMGLAGLPGSKLRFNTFVNLSGVDMGAQSISCNSNTDATSNVIAWHSSSTPNCAMRYSLFDSVVGVQPGTGNQVGDAATFFIDMENGNFHLAPGSPARGKGEPGLDVSTDLEGNPRPSTAPDIGAYQSP